MAKEVTIEVINPEVIEYREKYLFVYGSRGSGKSTTVAHKIISHALEYPKSKILVTRKTLPSLRVTAMRILLEELDKYQVPYDYKKTDHEIHFHNYSTIFFIPMYLTTGGRNERLKSSTFDWIWVEEATEFSFEDIKDVLVPTLRGQHGWRQMIFTFNPPPRANHWIYEWYDLQHKRKRARKVHFAYLDNPFLTDDYIEELESLKEYDEGLYRRYALGEWRVDIQEALIYTNWDTEILQGEPVEWIGGIDFGFNNPSVFLLIGLKENDVYVHREIYERNLLNKDFGEKIIALLKKHNLPINIPIYADGAEPDRIQELCNMGLNVYPAEKDVNGGINALKRMRIHIDPECENTKQEIMSYEWMKDKDGNLLDKPIKAFDHSMDALRYAVFTHSKFIKPFLQIV